MTRHKVLVVALDIVAASKIAETLKQSSSIKFVEEFIPEDFEITVIANSSQATKHINDPGYELIIASPEAINELWPSFLAQFACGAIIYPAVPKEPVSESIKKIAHNGKVLEY